MKKRLFTALAAATGLFLVGCGQDTGADDEVVRIAVAAPLTGDNAEYGIGFLNAAELQAEYWNANGGVLGREIVIVPFDDRNSAEEAASIAQRIVSDGNFAGVLGHFSSGVAMTAAPIYNENQIVNISPSAGHPEFTNIGEFIFRNNTLTTDQAAEMVDIAVNYLGLVNIGILNILTEWGTTASNAFISVIEGMDGVNLVAHEEVMEGSNDFSPSITNLQAAGADVILTAAMYSTLAPFARQYRQVQPDIEIVAFGNAHSHQLLELGGDAVEGIIFPVNVFTGSDAPAMVEFISRFTEEFGYSPSALTAQAFDSVGILLAAIEEAGTIHGPTVREVLADIRFTGVGGEFYFDGNRDVLTDFVTVIIQNRDFVEVIR